MAVCRDSSRRQGMRVLLALAAVSLLVMTVPAAAQTPAAAPVTFTKDIAPILQRSCQQCHRPDSIAPMSLMTYEQVRPWARGIKQRTQAAYAPGMRGVMPPWLYERNVGVQKLKEDQRLTDEEIALFTRWADTGAAQGNPADMPAPITFADNSRWFVGKPDLIVSSPPVVVKGIAPDWWGDLGETASDIPEDRYAASAEYKETSELTKSGGLLRNNTTPGTSLGQGKTSIFVFHHGGANVRRPTQEGSFDNDAEAGGGAGQLSLHEVGRNGDVFAADAGKLVPAKAIFTWNAHVHSPGVPGADRNAVLNVGLKLHPRGYKPKYREASIQISSTELEIRPDHDNQRYDAYWVAPQPFKLLNFEPHLHATGMRMCIEAIYQRAIETLSCAGYDHNWVRNYQYDENSAPILPKGTILHTISWFDGTPKNSNIVDPRNTTVWGRRSVQNMLGIFNKAFFLSEEEYLQEIAKRRDYLTTTNGWGTAVGCPGCFDRPAAAPAAAGLR